MKNSTKALLAGAAMTGLMTGAAVRAHAYQTPAASSDTLTISSSASYGLLDDSGTTGKHDCKGKNACKGQGGCKSDKSSCKGQNACKGQGGCNTNKS